MAVSNPATLVSVCNELNLTGIDANFQSAINSSLQNPDFFTGKNKNHLKDWAGYENKAPQMEVTLTLIFTTPPINLERLNGGMLLTIVRASGFPMIGLPFTYLKKIEYNEWQSKQLLDIDITKDTYITKFGISNFRLIISGVEYMVRSAQIRIDPLSTGYWDYHIDKPISIETAGVYVTNHYKLYITNLTY